MQTLTSYVRVGLVVACAAIGPSQRSHAGSPLDCGSVASHVRSAIAKAKDAVGNEAGESLWQGRVALRESLKRPDNAGSECWAAAADLAVAAGDAELATFALEALSRVSPDLLTASMRARLEEVGDSELLARLPKQREEFVAAFEMAEKGKVESYVSVGEMYRDGYGVPGDDEYAVDWFKKAAEAKVPRGQLRLGQMTMAGRGVIENLAGGLSLIRNAAEAGDAEAMYVLAACYARGAGTDVDEKSAMSWMQKSADAGNVDAAEYVGVALLNGDGVQKDLRRAIEMLSKAAEGGSATADLVLGSTFADVKSALRNDTKAVFHLDRAIERTSDDSERAIAAANLGGLIAQGRGVPRDDGKAFQLLTFAVEHGQEQAVELLATFYAQGLGTPKDDTLATNLFQRAAENGYSGAMVALYARLREGIGAAKNESVADDWLRKAAALGDERALAIMKQRGLR